MSVYAIRRVLILTAAAFILGAFAAAISPAVAGAGGDHSPEQTTTTEATTTTSPPITIPEQPEIEPKPPVSEGCIPANGDEDCDRTYECDGTGDGIPDHDYNDPTDGVCAAEKPDEPAPAAPTSEPTEAAPVEIGTPAAETLPVTGSGLDLAIFGATAALIGLALWRMGREVDA